MTYSSISLSLSNKNCTWKSGSDNFAFVTFFSTGFAYFSFPSSTLFLFLYFSGASIAEYSPCSMTGFSI